MKDNVILFGINGKAGTGKSTSAHGLVPLAQPELRQEGDTDRRSLVLSRLSFAEPLYRMATARQRIEGSRRKDRILYELHEVLYEVLGRSVLFGSLPSYDDFVSLVKSVAEFPCEPDGTKPRSFMQKTGLLCREYDEACFIKTLARKIPLEWLSASSDYPELETLVVVIEDVRFPNEIEYIKEQPRHILLKLVCDPQVATQRLLRRDGFVLNDEQLSHASESAMDTVPDTEFTDILDTTELSVEEQVTITNKLLVERL